VIVRFCCHVRSCALAWRGVLRGVAEAAAEYSACGRDNASTDLDPRSRTFFSLIFLFICSTDSNWISSLLPNILVAAQKSRSVVCVCVCVSVCLRPDNDLLMKWPLA